MTGPADDTGSGASTASAGAGRHSSDAGAFRGPAIPQTAIDDPALDDPALDEPALDDPALDDPALDDPTLDDRPVDPWDAPDDGTPLTDEPSDWAWVEEWRAGGEPVPWGPGLALAGFATFLVASAVYVLSAGLSDRPILAIGVNILVAGGLAPALWLSRALPVLRWIAGGAVLGVLVAWISVLIFMT